MGWVRINPRYRQSLHQQGLDQATAFLRLPGVILSGHPDRHVLRLDSGAILKKEHRVPWRDRLVNAWAGYGWVSKSSREAATLEKIARAGLPGPKPLAHGEGTRQAFLMLRDEPGLIDLRVYLQEHPDEQLSVARALGHQLARLHAAGFEHGDLYCKHVLVGPGPRFCFLDWQRAHQWKKLPWARRRRDLACLDATCPASVASKRVRLACLGAYCEHLTGPPWQKCAAEVRRLSLRLQSKPRIRAMQCLPLPSGAQNLIWLDGEALCVTQVFYEEFRGHIPECLRYRYAARNSLEHSRLPLGPGRIADLARRTAHGLGRWLVSWRGRLTAPEVQLAARLFRLERYQVPCPKLLAFGQRQRPWGQESLLLTETPPIEQTLFQALARCPSPRQRGAWLRQAGALVRKLHEAGHCLGSEAAAFARICAVYQKRLVLTRVDRLDRKKELWLTLARRDLPRLLDHNRPSRGDALRFYLGYLGARRLPAQGRELARWVLKRSGREVSR
jgi:tRNA A-37 threonylcarbamoyl transferase component Bud32